MFFWRLNLAERLAGLQRQDIAHSCCIEVVLGGTNEVTPPTRSDEAFVDHMTGHGISRTFLEPAPQGGASAEQTRVCSSRPIHCDGPGRSSTSVSPSSVCLIS